MREDRFTFLCNSDERRLITALAKRLQRTQSDVVRWLVREAARELGVISGTPEYDQERVSRARGVEG